jgi:hypothetical protein
MTLCHGCGSYGVASQQKSRHTTPPFPARQYSPTGAARRSYDFKVARQSLPRPAATTSCCGCGSYGEAISAAHGRSPPQLQLHVVAAEVTAWLVSRSRATLPPNPRAPYSPSAPSPALQIPTTRRLPHTFHPASSSPPQGPQRRDRDQHPACRFRHRSR